MTCALDDVGYADVILANWNLPGVSVIDLLAKLRNQGIRIPVLFLAGNPSQPDKGLAFDIDNCSVTRLDHFASADRSIWRLPMVNQQPWMADARHAAMHQPAGPEVTSKLA